MSYTGAIYGTTGSYTTLQYVLAAIGAVETLKILFKVFKFIYSLAKGHFLPRFVTTNVLKHGKWAGELLGKY